MQRREPIVLSQDIRTPALLLSSSQEPKSILSRTNASQLDLAPILSEHIPSLSTHGGPLHCFPTCVSWAEGARLDVQRPHQLQVLGLCRQVHMWKREASPGVHYTYPQPKKMNTTKEVRDST